MKNVTITMDEDVLGWARVEAAKRGESVSRFIAGIVREKRLAPAVSQSESLERFLAQPTRGEPLADPISTSRRDEIYDDALLHRFERAGLSARHEGFGED